MPKELPTTKSEALPTDLPHGRSLDATPKSQGIVFETGEPKAVLIPAEKKVRDVVRLSTFFSQGRLDLQKKYFYWMEENNYLADIDLPPSAPEFVLSLPIPIKHFPVPEQQQREFYEDMYDRLHAIATQSPGEIPAAERYSDLVGEIAKDLILKDDDYQMKERQGRTPGEQVTPDSVNDPHASFLRRYVLKSSPTGSDAFNTLFAQVREEVLPDLLAIEENVEGRPLTLRQSQLSRLAKGWEQNHPGEKFAHFEAAV